ncbi:MAG: hypothetical protein Q9170_002948 [Blastenia crenularia]
MSTAAHSSRITKHPSRLPSLKLSSTTPFSSFPHRKPVQKSASKPEFTPQNEDEEYFFGEKLEDLGLVTSLATDLSLRDVAQIIQYANTHMFDEIPERGGFGSGKIAEILNFRSKLPAVITVAHVHALAKYPTPTEREIVELIKGNVMKKVVIPGRGTGRSSVDEGLVLFRDLEAMLVYSREVERATKEKFLTYLKTYPNHSTIFESALSYRQTSSLKRAGFLTTTTHSPTPDHYSLPPSSSSSFSIPTIARSASGSLAATGGSGAVVEAGGTPTLRRSSSSLTTPSSSTEISFFGTPSTLNISLPNMGPYLHLLTTARSHLLSLLQKSRFRELPLYLLRERWDGGVSVSDDPAAERKRYRGEFAGALPARTKKWKVFYGLRFEWVLEECVGAGLVELFETGSVGKGVRVA